MPWLIQNNNTLVALDGAKPLYADNQMSLRSPIRDNISTFYDIED